MDTLNLNIAKDYTPAPGPRYEREGDWSGELFRKNIFFPLMNQAINEDKMLIVDLDGTAGYGTSFLEEIFGGLIREHNLDYDKILQHLEIKSDEEDYLKDDINIYLNEAKEQKKMANNI